MMDGSDFYAIAGLQQKRIVGYSSAFLSCRRNRRRRRRRRRRDGSNMAVYPLNLHRWNFISVIVHMMMVAARFELLTSRLVSSRLVWFVCMYVCVCVCVYVHVYVYVCRKHHQNDCLHVILTMFALSIFSPGRRMLFLKDFSIYVIQRDLATKV